MDSSSSSRSKRKRGRQAKDQSDTPDNKIARSTEKHDKLKNYDSQEEADEKTMALPLSKRLGTRLPDDPPLNKDGYRYYLAEPDPLNPESLNKELDYHGGVIPSKHYRRWWPEKVLLNSIDSAPQLRVDNKNLTVQGYHGYSSIRSTHSVTVGSWYFETEILEIPTKEEDPVKLGQNDSCCRVGFSTEKQILQSPCGYGPFGFSIRSKKGTFFHRSKGVTYGKTNFGKGDVIGCKIKISPQNALLTNKQVLKERFEHSTKNKKYKIHDGTDEITGNMSKRKSRKNKNDKIEFKIDENKVSKSPMPNCMKSQNDGVLIKYKGFYYFEVPETENASSAKATNFDSCYGELEFYKNGESLGIAHKGKIACGEYFPTISLYRSCKVKVNFGESAFKADLNTISAKPMCDRVGQMVVEGAISDVLYGLDEKLQKINQPQN